MRDAPAPGDGERPCAWFADARDGVLYFGEAAFWSALRAHGGDPRAELRGEGPKRIGRFDLAQERLLAPLELAPSARDGVWDVLAHPNGRIYFTSYFEPSGSVDPASGAVRLFPDAGLHLNELALGPDGSIFVTRYGADRPEGGAIVQLDPDGRIVAEHPLDGPEGFFAAPKSVAWDPLRRRIWVNTDLLPRGGGAPRYDARVLDEEGRELLRYDAPLLHFMTFGPDGTGYFAELEGSRLVLRVVAKDAPANDPLAGRRIVLDEGFPAALDAVQDVRVQADGRVAVVRWSGRLHVVVPDGGVRTQSLPRPHADGLYYTAELSGERVCATFCADVTVVCDALR